MPRPAQFDRNEVLQRAMETFWQKGYNATSMKDLTRVTGLQPGSLYGAFESKRSLFLQTLEVYYQFNVAGLDDRLSIDASPLERIKAVFERIIENSTMDPENKGCMMVNTLLEMPADDHEINRRLQEMFAQVEKRLEGVIREAQEAGQISSDRDAHTLAQTVLMGMNGMRVFCKTRPKPESLYQSLDSLLSVLTCRGKADPSAFRKPAAT